MMLDRRPAYSARTLAERWQCSEQLVRSLVKQGKLQRIENFSLLRITAEEVDRYEGTPPGVAEVEPAAEKRERSQAEPLPSPTPHVIYHNAKSPDWPQAMKRRTAAAYCELSEAAFEREVCNGRLPMPTRLGGQDHWLRPAIDEALRHIFGGGPLSVEPEFRRKMRERHATQDKERRETGEEALARAMAMIAPQSKPKR